MPQRPALGPRSISGSRRGQLQTAKSRRCRHSVLASFQRCNRGETGMKSKALFIWFLGLLIGIAAVDVIPDPPAVNPRTVSFASRLREVRGGVPEWRLSSRWSCNSHLQVRWIALASVYEPNLPVDSIAMTAFAADPSPPAPEAPPALYFHS